MAISWLTPAGALFDSLPPGSFLSLGVEAENASEYSLICGELPPGIEFQQDGSITGMIGEVDHDTTFTFVIRATDNVLVKDRTFSLSVAYNEDISWSTDGFNLSGSTLKKLLINKDHVEFQVVANVNTPVTYSIDRSTGELPFGLRLTPDGLIYGSPNIILAPGQVEEFSMDIVATDAHNTYRQNFTFSILDSFTFTVDNTTLVLGTGTTSLIDLGNTGTVTLSSLQPAEFVGSGDLGTALADDRQYISVRAYDPNPGIGPLEYRAVSTLPPGLSLDRGIGYLYGNLSPQADFSHLYDFSIEAKKSNIKTGEFVVTTGTFFLKVINQYYNNVVWPNSNLGTILEETASELTVAATQKDNTWDLNYYVVPGRDLPTGLALSTSTGNIIGNATTSGQFSFTIAASTATYQPHELVWPVLSDPVSFNTFNLTISPISGDFTSIWAKPFLIPSQRAAWETFINNDSIFLPEIIYRADDPTFGIQKELRVFLEFGIERVNIGDYASALYQNLYERRLTFGNVKTAIAKDKQGKHIYDAIYVDIIDELEGSKTSIEINGVTYYPGSVDNIRNSLQSVVLDDGGDILVDGRFLPKFMTTVYGDQPYGYIRAAVLCYTKPGESNKILNRIRASKFNFNNLSFFIDRLVVQNSLDQTGTTYIAFNRQPIG